MSASITDVIPMSRVQTAPTTTTLKMEKINYQFLKNHIYS